MWCRLQACVSVQAVMSQKVEHASHICDILNCHIISHKSRQLSYQVRPEKRRNYEEERERKGQGKPEEYVHLEL